LLVGWGLGRVFQASRVLDKDLPEWIEPVAHGSVQLRHGMAIQQDDL
jgi:hypothetical protein